MDKATLIQDICELILNDKKSNCIEILQKHYPFTDYQKKARQYTKLKTCQVFLRDGFIDRYSGEKLIFPGLIKIMTIEFPEIFKYHLNWKMTDTHMIYWELFPTIDHLIPLARGGDDSIENLVTTSMKRNSAKANWTLNEIGWPLFEKGNLKKWDGLTTYFLELVRNNPNYEKDQYIQEWKKSLIKALK